MSAPGEGAGGPAGVRRIETLLVPAPGYRSREVAVKVSELVAVHGLLRDAVRDLTPAELSHQAAPGRNTIGMLLTHVAMVEVHLAQVGLVGDPDGHVLDVLGIRPEEDGMPLRADGAPPANLAGRDAAYFLGLLDRAEAHTRAACEPLTDELLGLEIVRPRRPDGTQRVFDRRWILFHMVEHAALHNGQVMALRNSLRPRP